MFWILVSGLVAAVVVAVVVVVVRMAVAEVKEETDDIRRAAPPDATDAHRTIIKEGGKKEFMF